MKPAFDAGLIDEEGGIISRENGRWKAGCNLAEMDEGGIIRYDDMWS